ncbi:retron Ec67 family RNA-directed DNA polymerase/endonuclease [Brevundimonas diminuta]|uniref:retron Ec67 family RNA-directed DNA polymerase/endonuclease n=1 Tax=Brevundimonas diminuta TaxID=293 RepID=UPI001906CD82|nr:retron Ec67 family RNA-directed DNA polymerase/endonuclease [Brevundimonas diminuta]MBK1969959.1 retron Ec67 family RNA-directed DNA polymerase/endonuclease [Brevundimonas diminuta]
MSTLAALKNVLTLRDMAGLLDVEPRQLSFALYKLTPQQKYDTFEIPKKGGGVRTIHAPRGVLKDIQARLAALLYDCVDEIQVAKPRRPVSHGFRRSLSIITNAARHTNRRYVFNLDLEDFFPTFNFGRVRGFFLKDQDFLLSEKAATLIAQIACRDGALPQGSPCSPIIADLIAHILDVRLLSLAKTSKVTYSRYADDLTFSTNQKIFPPAIATGGAGPEDAWVIGSPLARVIERAGFSINTRKTRMQERASRQLVTGLTVNSKVNVTQSYWRSIRSMCHSLFQTGAYYRPIRTGEPPTLLMSLSPLAGMLSHVHHVKRESGVRPDRPGKDFQFGHKEQEDFWFYATFIALTQPLIVTEGKTDGVYLRNAIRNLPAFHPALGHITPEGFSFGVRIFNYENQTHQRLRITGGIGPLSTFMIHYGARLKRYGHRPLAAPVIVLIDNDTALTKELRAALDRNYGVKVDLLTPASFYHLTDNLYLVKTPELGASGVSCIEDFFDTATRKLPLDGKTFHADGKGFDPTRHIGKSPFAKKIVAPRAATIDWTGFAPLLSRIAAVVAHYKH